ncbi:MAG: hypothetical protein IOD12_15325 [Silvanigrellales bacterium]|nr:hypothetical protein [Silvanigrellales bacterium]
MTGLQNLGWSWQGRAAPAECPPCVGVEYASFRLVPNTPCTFRAVEFVYLPLRGMGASLLAHNAGHVLAHMGVSGNKIVSKALVDWPTAFEPHVEQMVSLTPAGFVLAPETSVSLGSLAGGTGVEDLSRVWLVEALNPRRLLLATLRKAALAAGATWKVTCSGGFDANVAALVSEELCLADGPFPTEHLLPFGLLPFMEGRAATFRKSVLAPSLLEKAKLHAGSMALDILEAENQGVPTVAIIDEWGLLTLPEALATAHQHEAVLQTQSGRVTPITSLKAHRERQGARLVPARPAPEHHAQYAGCNGFQARFLVQEFERALGTPHVVTKTPMACFAESLVTSFDAAAARFGEWTRVSVSGHERTSVFRYLRRLAKEQDRAFPTPFDMLVAAQSVVSSNLSYEWLKECRTFPGQESSLANALPEIQLPLTAFTPKVSVLSVERFDTIQRHRPRAKPRGLEKGKRISLGPETAVDESKHADNAWVHGNHPYSCSFPEEDVFMEEFSFGLRKQAAEKVRGLETRTHELTTSLEEGLDLRQTIRQWHLGKIFVREEVNLAKADIGAIVFRFECGLSNEDVEERYAWRAFWQAEAHDNSHLLFYATPFQETLIGPGVAKSEFGGFAVLPLTSVAFDPWHDPYIRSLCRTPAEALLLASALATRERSLLYISPEPPPKELARLVKRSGKSILYQRLDDCPPDKIRRLRTFHILAEAGVRAYADKYIRKDT